MVNSSILFYNKFHKGKYSLEYYKKFFNIFKYFPFKEPLKEHYITHNMIMFENYNNCQNYITENNVSFQDVPFLSSFSKIKECYGNPHMYSIDVINGHTISIAAYNNLLKSRSNRTVFYFFDNELVEAEYILNDVTVNKDKDIYMNNIQKKYIQEYEISYTDSICIKDKDHNLIFAYWNGFEFSIKYLSAFANIYKETIVNYYNNSWKAQIKKN